MRPLHVSLRRHLLWGSNKKVFMLGSLPLGRTQQATCLHEQCGAEQQKFTFQTRKKRTSTQQQVASRARHHFRPEAKGTPEDSGSDVACL